MATDYITRYTALINAATSLQQLESILKQLEAETPNHPRSEYDTLYNNYLTRYYQISKPGSVITPGPVTTPFPVATPGPTDTTPVDTSKLSPDELSAQQESDLEAAYLNLLGIPAFGASPYQRWQTQQAGPMLGAYRMSLYDDPDLALSQFMSGGITGVRGQIPTMFNRMAATDPSTELGAAFVPGQMKAAGGYWDDVLQSLASSKYGRFFGPQLAGGFPQMQRQYEQGAGFEQQNPELAFLKYIRDRYGM